MGLDYAMHNLMWRKPKLWSMITLRTVWAKEDHLCDLERRGKSSSRVSPHLHGRDVFLWQSGELLSPQYSEHTLQEKSVVCVHSMEHLLSWLLRVTLWTLPGATMHPHIMPHAIQATQGPRSMDKCYNFRAFRLVSIAFTDLSGFVVDLQWCSWNLPKRYEVDDIWYSNTESNRCRPGARCRYNRDTQAIVVPQTNRDYCHGRLSLFRGGAVWVDHLSPVFERASFPRFFLSVQHATELTNAPNSQI